MSKVIEFPDNDEPGLSRPFIEDNRGILTLRFNLFDVQSEMVKQSPYELVLGYTRVMAKAMTHAPVINRIGMIGLGGGSLPKYIYYNYPDAFISIAEINPAVIELRDLFHIPSDGHRFKVYCEDGADFVQRCRNTFDVLLVDGFDRRGQPPQLSSAKFYSDCYRSLRPQGLLIANLCGNERLIPAIRASFGSQMHIKDSDSHMNTIVVAGKGAVPAQEAGFGRRPTSRRERFQKA